jgi:uncharacterized iron-regulated membrane protein
MMNTLRHINRLDNLKQRRKLWLKLHLWLGLGLGFILALIGLTGSLLVFWQEIDHALNPALYQASTSTAIEQPIDAIFAAAETAAPAGWVASWTDAPIDSASNYLISFGYEQPTTDADQAISLTLAVDPYTAKVVGKRVFYHAWNPFKSCLVGFFFKLHYALFLGQVGTALVGALAVVFIVSTLSGLILWWPLSGNWRRVLTIKSRASSERFNYDLHQTAGFYSVPIMLWLLISGIYLNLPEQFKWLVEVFSPVTADIEAVTTEINSNEDALQRAIQQVKAEHPASKLHYIIADKQLFTPCFNQVAALKNYVLDESCWTFARQTGQLLQIKDAAHGSIGDTVMAWQWPLHSGKVFGWPGRILVFVTGLICPLLLITGVIRWLQKRRATKLNQAKQSSIYESR